MLIDSSDPQWTKLAVNRKQLCRYRLNLVCGWRQSIAITQRLLERTPVTRPIYRALTVHHQLVEPVGSQQVHNMSWEKVQCIERVENSLDKLGAHWLSVPPSVARVYGGGLASRESTRL
eukprot:scaffold211099_cov30-Tisochrysis_lutea.AAC.2